MAGNNYEFYGDVPDGVSVEWQCINRALLFQATHTVAETFI
jgi:hypothetical protein